MPTLSEHSTSMASSRGDQNDNSQPTVPPPQDQPSQSTPTSQGNHADQAAPSTEQGVNYCVATWRPGDSTIVCTPEQLAIWQEGMRLAALGPLPDPDEDDFLDEPLSKPFDPNWEPDWAKADAWIEEKDSEGRTLWRNRIIHFVSYSEPLEVREARDRLQKANSSA
ncbi:uncharacterized protein LY89DRAFT_712919 [Mollisia scopiformis]|uniref:Uncharacterized protein n=1 Tax=Mollisia scopiformis TaxID=149040 RepID=A0A194XUS8_MOLSC|nr:uncharacterized protein LY89DRAFT_712919 [Mollisia scopiformis]KUJ23963.1 hypothetical protein LY89DRAFT_712919 [Mollisia scopiformis]